MEALILLTVAAVAALVLGKDAYAMGNNSETNSGVGQNSWGLPDTSRDNQKGGYKKDYDAALERGARKYGIPFALIKAHAIRESSLNPKAVVDESKGRKSYGLCQVLWWPDSERFSIFGISDSRIGRDGQNLFDPDLNCEIAAALIEENLRRFNGNLRDAINAYNTGAKESVRVAPANYVDNVLNYYSKIVGVQIT